MTRRPGQGEPDAVEDGAEGRQSLVDVATDEELVGRPALEFEQFGLRRQGGGIKEGVRRLIAAAGIGQGVAEPRAKPPAVSVVRRTKLQGAAIERDGAVEGEHLGHLVRRHCVVLPGLVAVTGPVEVDGERLRVDVAGLLQLARQRPVPGGRLLGRKVPGDGLTDAVVVGLDVVERPGARPSDHVVGPQQGQRREPLGPEPGHAAGDRLVERPARDGQGFEEGDRFPRQLLDASPEDLVEADRPPPRRPGSRRSRSPGSGTRSARRRSRGSPPPRGRPDRRRCGPPRPPGRSAPGRACVPPAG